MVNPLQPGGRGDPLPAGEVVIRLIKPSKDGKASETAFELSTQDRQSPLQSISVWAAQLTTAKQAREFMGEKKDAYQLYCLLNVDDVRAVRPTPLNPEVKPLDVVWDPLTIKADIVERIRIRAYFHFENQTGHNWQDAVSNWLQAEREETEQGGIEVADTRPGANGHSGITGLSKPPRLPSASLYYRSLRSQLTDLANKTLVAIESA